MIYLIFIDVDSYLTLFCQLGCKLNSNFKKNWIALDRQQTEMLNSVTIHIYLFKKELQEIKLIFLMLTEEESQTCICPPDTFSD